MPACPVRVHDAPVRIVIDISSTEPLEGAAVVDDGAVQAFAGWLQLLTLLDRLVSDERQESGGASTDLSGELGAVADPQLGEDV